MPYLSKDDYTLHIAIDHLDTILAQAIQGSGLTADTLRLEAEDTAQAEITAKIGGYFNMVTEFATTGANRNRLIKKCMIDIAIFHIMFTVNPRDIPEAREKLYNNCIEELQAVVDGKLNFGLVAIDADADGEPDISRININGHQKFISKPFTDQTLIQAKTTT